jgi:hypothetical protein
MCYTNQMYCSQVILSQIQGRKMKYYIMFANVNSLLAESGQRFNVLTLRLLNNNIHIACLCETGSGLKLDY